MQTTLEETGRHSVKLSIEVPPEEFGKDLDRTYRKLANQVKVPGFRKGKVPKEIIDSQLGQDTVMAEFVQDHLYDYYLSAIREHDLAPITDPQIDLDDVEPGKLLTFRAEVEVRPRLTLDDYKGIEVERTLAEPSDEEIDEQLDRLRDRFAELEPVERPAADGDYVTIDLSAASLGVPIEEATRQDALYMVGSGMYVPALDAQLPGKKKGDILKFTDRLPEGLGDSGGNEAEFTCLLKEVKGKKLPDLDDEFAKLASEFDTLDELRAALTEQIERQLTLESDREMRDAVLAVLIDRIDVDIPETLIEHEVEHRVNRVTEQAERAGATLDEMLESEGLDEVAFRSEARAHAIRAIKSDLILEAVSRQEELEVSSEDIGREVGALAQLTGNDPRDLAKRMNESGQITSLAGDIIRSKALDFLVEHAIINGEPAAAAVPDQAPPEESEDDTEEEHA